MLTLVIPWLRPLTPIKENSMLGKAKEIYKELNCYTIGMAWIPDIFMISSGFPAFLGSVFPEVIGK